MEGEDRGQSMLRAVRSCSLLSALTQSPIDMQICENKQGSQQSSDSHFNINQIYTSGLHNRNNQIIAEAQLKHSHSLHILIHSELCIAIRRPPALRPFI